MYLKLKTSDTCDKKLLNNLHYGTLIVVCLGSNDSKIELQRQANVLRSVEAKVVNDSKVSLIERKSL